MRNERGSAGFTLLEIIIAMAIMMVAFTAILSVESSSIGASARGKQMNVVGMLTRNAMTELEYDWEGKTFDEYKKEGGKTFDAPFQDYRYTFKVKELKFPTLNLKSAGNPDGNGSTGNSQGDEIADMLTKLITNFLSKNIREVQLTVYWKRGSGEASFSVSQYWVAYNNALELSE
jgi:general secretion pathway protein I